MSGLFHNTGAWICFQSALEKTETNANAIAIASKSSLERRGMHRTTSSVATLGILLALTVVLTRV